ncbi:Translation initiation factor IF-3 [Phycisphaerae bacterium RAS1]|nr:Translation initiation factor IF-3 [Phycisphaerae bacterium RAS1]
MRVINEATGEQLGVIPTFEAQRIAREQGLDLVEVAPTVRPPVCKIMDYGKWKYQQKKNQKKHHEQQLKEVRLRPKTDDHDRDIKIARAIQFLREGDKVQFTMQFRGRERSHREIGMETFREILTEFGEHVKIERPPSMEGKNMVMIVSPGKVSFPAKAGEAKPPASGAAGKQTGVGEDKAPRDASSQPDEPADPSPSERTSPTPVAAVIDSRPG